VTTGYLANATRKLGSIAFAILLCSLVFQLIGLPARDLLHGIVDGAILGRAAWQDSLRWAMPLFVTACGVVIAFRCGFYNVGAQGQFYAGAIGAAFICAFLPDLPAIIIVPVAIIVAMVSGALWALWPGLLKVLWNADEVITTLMGNFIASLVLAYVTAGILKDPAGTGQVTASRPVSAAYRLSDASGLSPAIFTIVAAVGVGCWILLNRTAFGVLSGLVGRNPTMALWQGLNLKWFGLIGFALSGGLAGLAGSLELLGANGRLVSGFLPSHGFLATLTAIVADLSVGGTVLAALFFGGLSAAALYLPIVAGFPAAAIDCLNAAIAVLVTARSSPRFGWLRQWLTKSPWNGR
jgi:simple sugar transport system permease protein